MFVEKDANSREGGSFLGAIRRIISRIRTFMGGRRGKSFSRGSFIVETALTLPVFCYLLFFLLEMMKVNETKTAIDSITSEAVFNFVFSKNTDSLDAVIEKYRPSFIPVGNIRYWIRMYTDLAAMCAVSPYGGEGIAYPEDASDHSRLSLSASMEFIDFEKNNIFLQAAGNLSDLTVATYLTNLNTPPGTAFVITFVCDYPFSSAMVGKLFSGGKNTIKNDGAGTAGTMYLIWGRGVGIMN
jgi:hypothetical protein